MTNEGKCLSDSTTPTESQHRKVLKGATSIKLGSLPAQGTSRDGSWLVSDGTSEQTIMRKPVLDEVSDCGRSRLTVGTC